MLEMQMVKGALKLLNVCASLKPGEEVLIIADYNTEKIGKAIATAAYQIGAEPILIYLVVPNALMAAGTCSSSSIDFLNAKTIKLFPREYPQDDNILYP